MRATSPISSAISLPQVPTIADAESVLAVLPSGAPRPGVFVSAPNSAAPLSLRRNIQLLTGVGGKGFARAMPAHTSASADHRVSDALIIHAPVDIGRDDAARSTSAETSGYAVARI